MAKVWFTADEHHWHLNIIRLTGRPFVDAAEMSREIVDRHNAVVQPGDLVYHIGDFAWGGRNVARLLEQMNGHHLLVVGNHDPCHPMHRRHAREAKVYGKAGFIDVVVERAVDAPPLGCVMLCHFPLYQPGDEGLRYPGHRPRALLPGCRWLLCGHVHEKWFVRGRSVNVGVDQHRFAPVSADYLAGRLSVLEGMGAL